MYSWIRFYFFCFKQKTAYEMRISDWSSDVCSSDLHVPQPTLEVDDAVTLLVTARDTARGHMALVVTATGLALAFGQRLDGLALMQAGFVDEEIGSASCRERVCQ